jgi:hypothetical protein
MFSKIGKSSEPDGGPLLRNVNYPVVQWNWIGRSGSGHAGGKKIIGKDRCFMRGKG